MKRRLQQFAPLVIHAYEEADFHLPIHGHTYYELVYIRAGHGQHWLNGHTTPYAAGNLFFIAPEDEHRFDIAELTRFVFIKFTDTYFQQASTTSDPDKAELLALLHAQWLKENVLTFTEPQAAVLRRLTDNLADYAPDPELSRSASVYQQVLALLCLVREALTRQHQPATARPPAPGPEQVLAYVHQHIYRPAAVQTAAVAERFCIAPSYFGAYFRREMGTSYRHYVNGYRTQLLENRAAQGATLKQLVAEFGFTDETHLSRYFRQQTGQGFKEYKQLAGMAG